MSHCTNPTNPRTRFGAGGAFQGVRSLGQAAARDGIVIIRAVREGRLPVAKKKAKKKR